ncbi:hypothetical protein TVAG_080810 [Trichomonas vaginalis G3]|uniref:DNA damage-binding protein 1 n=1 Tax=Trichomonas vaginalis (strain ATCC PRA-98 / G3) TaxID=412133 RepID=A2EPA4_TRIV3|nr:DNA repair/RNA processing CPSF family [Trichomonas vaginalis G3]EAY05489.1 hypothetical protein TVAG_080810 [Trichomonas vaginalis G3]KAI5507792.1 DNA repair/RNA processing CPSF family [Trichomonas vaginalis G3]|eukprot:XP_001317712.1 hypothetical protein [Trichomonas vaginalis G3]
MVDIDYYFSNAEEDIEENFVYSIFRMEEVIDFVYCDSQYIDIFTPKSFYRLDQNGNVKFSYNLPIDSKVVSVLETPKKSLYIFFILGDIYEFFNGEFKYIQLGSQANNTIYLDEGVIFISSLNGPSIFLKDSTIYNMYSSPMIETLAKLPETRDYPPRIIAAGGIIFGVVALLGVSMRPIAKSFIEEPDINIIFGVGDTALCSSCTETKIFGENIPILNFPTLYAAELVNGYIQVTNDYTLIVNNRVSEENTQNFEKIDGLIRNFEKTRINILKSQYVFGNKYKDMVVLYYTNHFDIFRINSRFSVVLQKDIDTEISSIAFSDFIFVSTWKNNLIKMDYSGNILSKLDLPRPYVSLQVCGQFLFCGTHSGRVFVYDFDFNIVKEVGITISAVFLIKRDENCLLATSDRTNIIFVEGNNIRFVKLIESTLVAATFYKDCLLVSDGNVLDLLEFNDQYELYHIELINVPGTAVTVAPVDGNTYLVLDDDNTCVISESRVYETTIDRNFEFPSKEIISSLVTNGKYHFASGQIISDDLLFNEKGLIYTLRTGDTKIEAVHRIEVPHAATEIALNGDLAYVSVGGFIYVYKIDETGFLNKIAEYPCEVSAMRLRIDHGKLMVFDICKSIIIFDIIGEELKLKCRDRRYKIAMSACFVTDDDILMCDGDGYLRLLKIVGDSMQEIDSFFFGMIFNDLLLWDSMPDKIVPMLKFGQKVVVGGTSNGALYAFPVIEGTQFEKLKKTEDVCINFLNICEFFNPRENSRKDKVFADLSLLSNVLEEYKCHNLDVTPFIIECITNLFV